MDKANSCKDSHNSSPAFSPTSSPTLLAEDSAISRKNNRTTFYLSYLGVYDFWCVCKNSQAPPPEFKFGKSNTGYFCQVLK